MIRKQHGRPKRDETPPQAEAMSPENVRRIELELHNEELHRKQAEEALEIERNRLRTLVDLLPALIFVKDRESRFIMANAACARHMGASSERDLIGRTDAEFYPPKVAAGYRRDELAVLKGEPELNKEKRVKRPDGSEQVLLTTKMPLRDDDGEIIGLVGASVDISESRRSEEALRASEAIQRSILNTLPAHIAVLDEAGNILAVNEPWLKFARLYGDTRKEKIGVGANYFEACQSACHNGNPHAQAAVAGLKSVLAGKQPRFTLEYPVDTPGCLRWFSLEVLQPVGNVGGAIVSHAEITERKHAQQLLAWEKSALEAIVSLKSLSEVLDGLMLGLESQIPGGICSVLLLDEDGIHLRHGAAPSLPDAYNRIIDGVAIGPKVGSCGTAVYENRQVIVSDIATDPLWADYPGLASGFGLHACWSTPIHCSQGKILGTFAVYYREPRHPTQAELELIDRAVHVVRIAIERDKAEREIRKFRAELEHRVEERTRELQAANRELESFSYSVSHDLRAPLRAIDGFSRMVLDDNAGRLNDKGRRMLGVIHSEAQRMGRLIDDLLTFSRLGRQPIVPARIDMHAMAREVFDELAAGKPERKLRLNLHPLPPARGVEAMIRQVWVNLIGNAIKFTRNREIAEIEIGVLAGGDGGRTYFVKDNGAGFEMRHAEKLFGVFERLHTQQEFSGTGVGLAFVHRILQRHGGRVWAEAEVDRGATFFFTLPD